MLIGINAAAAFKQPRTGVEEYTAQIIRHLTMLEESRRHRFVLYNNQKSAIKLPENFEFKHLKWPLPMWTQVRLATEMAVSKPEVLFIPVHILPLIHPKNSVVTIHGLEYEYYPRMYPWRHLRYLRWSTQYALKNTRKIIAVSENTKKDLVELYGGQPEKIEVVYHGLSKVKPFFPNLFAKKVWEKRFNLGQEPYILFVGRLEKKKNIQGLIKAFNLLKKRYQVPHKLVLMGPLGYGLRRPPQGQSLKWVGYVSEQEKWSLLKNADIFVLPSFYEGFGLPILEAQAVGCPVITSNVSSMPEVAGDGAILIDPKNIEQIAEGIYQVIKDKNLRKDLMAKGYQNIKRFSWQKCASQTLRILTEL